MHKLTKVVLLGNQQMSPQKESALRHIHGWNVKVSHGPASFVKQNELARYIMERQWNEACYVCGDDPQLTVLLPRILEAQAHGVEFGLFCIEQDSLMVYQVTNLKLIRLWPAIRQVFATAV